MYLYMFSKEEKRLNCIAPWNRSYHQHRTLFLCHLLRFFCSFFCVCISLTCQARTFRRYILCKLSFISLQKIQQRTVNCVVGSADLSICVNLSFAQQQIDEKHFIFQIIFNQNWNRYCFSSAKLAKVKSLWIDCGCFRDNDGEKRNLTVNFL